MAKIIFIDFNSTINKHSRALGVMPNLVSSWNAVLLNIANWEQGMNSLISLNISTILKGG